ncbi:SigE family RNA polymerase sigma factor [Longispora sp. NPDC051575]|uniref:SigE family RNA polymerase sigma factor n=1 Tax=Longispora sp. NPDC051575 TaxID=3154943 RepID=UPI00343874FC
MTFEEYAAARLPALLRYATVLTGERALAEDVVQEVLVRAHARWRRIDEPESYLRRMVVNEYLSWRRRWSRVVPHASVGLPPSDAPDHPTSHADRDALRAELALLPRRQRAVIVLRYYQGLTDAEIADALGCSPGTVRGYASRALATLRVSPRVHLTQETR